MTCRPARRACAVVMCAATSAVTTSCGDVEPGAFDPRGSAASDIAWLFWLMVALSIPVFVLVLALLVRAGRHHDSLSDADEPDERGRRRSTRLVIGGGVVLPVVILVPLTIAMLVVADRISPQAAEDPYEIRVIGHKFWWEAVYPGGVVTANEIHIPTGTPVRVELLAGDVIHSFWVPQLAGKVDMIPGETTEVVIDADQPGEYLGQCAEFCGLQHARMRFLVIAQPPDEFEEWLEQQAMPAEQPRSPGAGRGAEVFVEAGCGACHAVRGTEATGEIGPDLTHLATRRTIGAATLPNERDELADWIRDPHDAKPGNLMPATQLGDDELDDLLDYLLELG